ncbi:hypothetical protein PHLGIDRAFT_473725 [Phlebiopsis gigantea 11061_1 CR5-6]|uniref:RNase III domain-containing protein n=1 Tax=Phlebiopsis gigantea (strain 11061_1 CR5-6) TaxID=745531 RepID=A0A0C3SD11_PHLG1|nr:hypothetical protein PHLGIDRAFT_473725 [Phlebiopsis gigantea 11061_1 CR5-6]
MALHLAIQDAILTEIARPEFSAALPPLSDEAWRSIVGNTPRAHKENERLEFLGDAMMYAALGHHLYTQIPDGTPGLFTEVRAALHSNLTFSRLAEKLDIFAVSDYVLKALTARTFGEGTSAPEKTKGHVKATADLFETVIGSYYLECGYQALCSWVDDLYFPLVAAGRRAYGDNMVQECPRKRFTLL